MYETLWIDKPIADAFLSDLLSKPETAELGSKLEHFHKYGYCILEKAVQPEIIDRYLAEVAGLLEGDRLKISLGLDILPAKGADILVPLTKLLDTHWLSEAATEISFAAPIMGFLDLLFGEPALAFQTLHFETGSTQAVHNDTAYVVLDEPKSLCATWVALEDIQPGTGELVYYPGGHRFGEFLYPNEKKSWNADEDGHEIHNHHLGWLHKRAKELGVDLQMFQPKKGDVLFWHADLPHGGGPITKPNSTRRSLVTHYCPVHCTPNYFRFLPPERQVKRRADAGGFLSSYYYE